MPSPVGTILEFSIKGKVNGQTCITVLHYRVKTVGTAPTPFDECNFFLDGVQTGGPQDFISSYRNCQSNEYIIDELRAQIVAPTRFAAVPRGTTEAGLQPADCRAQNVSGVITKGTALAGRSQIGSVHIPGIAVSNYLAGSITAGLGVNMDTLGTKVKQNVGPAADNTVWEPVLWHRGNPVQPSSDKVTSTITQDELRVMRRRTKGVGI